LRSLLCANLTERYLNFGCALILVRVDVSANCTEIIEDVWSASRD
jgi:hypothetical protein